MQRPSPPLQTVYIVRCWVEESAEAPYPRWRFVLQDTHSGQSRGFTTVDALAAHLWRCLSEECDQKTNL